MQSTRLYLSIISALVICPTSNANFLKKEEALSDKIFIQEQKDFAILLGKLINTYRQKLGLSKIEPSSQLNDFALSRANYIHHKNGSSLSHHEENNTGISRYIEKNTEGLKFIGENLAKNFSNPAKTLLSWIESPKHKEVITAPNITNYGLAVYGSSSITVLIVTESNKDDLTKKLSGLNSYIAR